MVIVFRGTETVKEWARNANVKMVLLEGAEKLSGFELGWARWVRLKVKTFRDAPRVALPCVELVTNHRPILRLS